MKGLLLWALFVVFLWLAITAFDMGEYTIAGVLGVIALGCAWAAPSGKQHKERKPSRRTESMRR